jgi:hypothetical protein
MDLEFTVFTLFCRVAVQELEWRENNEPVVQGNDLLDKIRAECRASPSARAECAAKVFHSLLNSILDRPKFQLLRGRPS